MEQQTQQDPQAQENPQAAEGFNGFPTQAHHDHHIIMKAHEVIRDPARMDAVRALHGESGGLINFLKAKQKAFAAKESQGAGPEVAPTPESTTPEQDAGKKKSFQVE